MANFKFIKKAENTVPTTLPAAASTAPADVDGTTTGDKPGVVDSMVLARVPGSALAGAGYGAAIAGVLSLISGKKSKREVIVNTVLGALIGGGAGYAYKSYQESKARAESKGQAAASGKPKQPDPFIWTDPASGKQYFFDGQGAMRSMEDGRIITDEAKAVFEAGKGEKRLANNQEKADIADRKTESSDRHLNDAIASGVTYGAGTAAVLPVARRVGKMPTNSIIGPGAVTPDNAEAVAQAAGNDLHREIFALGKKHDLQYNGARKNTTPARNKIVEAEVNRITGSLNKKIEIANNTLETLRGKAPGSTIGIHYNLYKQHMNEGRGRLRSVIGALSGDNKPSAEISLDAAREALGATYDMSKLSNSKKMELASQLKASVDARSKSRLKDIRRELTPNTLMKGDGTIGEGINPKRNPNAATVLNRAHSLKITPDFKSPTGINMSRAPLSKTVAEVVSKMPGTPTSLKLKILKNSPVPVAVGVYKFLSDWHSNSNNEFTANE